MKLSAPLPEHRKHDLGSIIERSGWMSGAIVPWEMPAGCVPETLEDQRPPERLEAALHHVLKDMRCAAHRRTDVRALPDTCGSTSSIGTR
jgi:hypothetical protein